MKVVGRKQHGEYDYEEDVKIGAQPMIYHRSLFSTILRSYVCATTRRGAASVPSLLFLSYESWRLNGTRGDLFRKEKGSETRSFRLVSNIQESRGIFDK